MSLIAAMMLAASPTPQWIERPLDGTRNVIPPLYFWCGDDREDHKGLHVIFVVRNETNSRMYYAFRGDDGSRFESNYASDVRVFSNADSSDEAFLRMTADRATLGSGGPLELVVRTGNPSAYAARFSYSDGSKSAFGRCTQAPVPPYLRSDK